MSPLSLSPIAARTAIFTEYQPRRRTAMLKLTYSAPDDKYQTVTVLGDARGLWDLWYRLTRANPGNPNDQAANVKITTLAGAEIDPAKGIVEMLAYDSPLSRLS
jgi:hypothetical protein